MLVLVLVLVLERPWIAGSPADKEEQMSAVFDHERLDVYRVSIQFAAWVGELLDGVLAGCHLSAARHLDKASTSSPLNIAEGNGKRSPKDRCRYLDIAKGSALESSACLDVLVARKALAPSDVTAGKELLRRVVEMLTKMTATLLKGR